MFSLVRQLIHTYADDESLPYVNITC